MDSRLTFSERDEFQRVTIAQNIAKLIESDIPISPLVIDGDWGTGKTEFSLKLKTMITEKVNDRVVYIDAFKEDHTDTPIISIAAAIYAAFPEKERHTFLQKSLPALKFGLKTTLKAGAGWVLKKDIDILADDFQNAVKDIADKSIEHTIEETLKEHANHDKNIKALQDSLTSISEKHRIVIIVDELDRCRPSYAVNFLESIKHIFQTKNVVFILIANMHQIRSSISHAYGVTIDSKKYLDKFIKYTINLPVVFHESSNNILQSASVTHWVNLVNNRKSGSEAEYLKSFPVKDLIRKAGLSLREVETLLLHTEVYSTITNEQLIVSDIYEFDQHSTLLAIFLYCFCSRETINNLTLEESIRSMTSRLGLRSLNWLNLNNDRPAIFDIIFFIYVQPFSNFDKAFYNPIAIEDKLRVFLSDKTTPITHQREKINKNITNTFRKLSMV